MTDTHCKKFMLDFRVLKRPRGLLACELCGAVVPRDLGQKHTNWHAEAKR